MISMCCGRAKRVSPSTPRRGTRWVSLLSCSICIFWRIPLKDKKRSLGFLVSEIWTSYQGNTQKPGVRLWGFQSHAVAGGWALGPWRLFWRESSLGVRATDGHHHLRELCRMLEDSATGVTLPVCLEIWFESSFQVWVHSRIHHLLLDTAPPFLFQ